MAKGKGKASTTGLNASATHLLHRALRLALDFHAEAAGEGAITQRQLTVLAAAGAADGLALIAPKRRDGFVKTLAALAAAADAPQEAKPAKAKKKKRKKARKARDVGA